MRSGDFCEQSLTLSRPVITAFHVQRKGGIPLCSNIAWIVNPYLELFVEFYILSVIDYKFVIRQLSFNRKCDIL